MEAIAFAVLIVLPALLACSAALLWITDQFVEISHRRALSAMEAQTAASRARAELLREERLAAAIRQEEP